MKLFSGLIALLFPKKKLVDTCKPFTMACWLHTKMDFVKLSDYAMSDTEIRKL